MNRIERLKEHGYNPIHLFGNWYLVRRKSIHYRAFSTYKLVKVKVKGY